MLYTLRFFSLQNAVCFIMLTCLVPVLITFYIQGVQKLKKNNSGAKGLKKKWAERKSRNEGICYDYINISPLSWRSQNNSKCC